MDEPLLVGDRAPFDQSSAGGLVEDVQALGHGELDHRGHEAQRELPAHDRSRPKKPDALG
jgi:hypothetical protein